MNLTIIGSTGLTGSLVLADALRRGHHVVALTRRPERLPDQPGPQRVVVGDGRDQDAVRKAVQGSAAVIAIVSARSRKGPHHTAHVATVLTSVMAETGVDRLVITSAYPLVGERPRVAMALLQRIFADAYADMRAMERHVNSTSLDWTIVRLNRLTNAAEVQPLRITPELFERPSALSRRSAAAALLDIAESGAHPRAAVNIAGGGTN
jgi:putative NADH-flavin reductase